MSSKRGGWDPWFLTITCGLWWRKRASPSMPWSKNTTSAPVRSPGWSGTRASVPTPSTCSAEFWTARSGTSCDTSRMNARAEKSALFSYPSVHWGRYPRKQTKLSWRKMPLLSNYILTSDFCGELGTDELADGSASEFLNRILWWWKIPDQYDPVYLVFIK